MIRRSVAAGAFTQLLLPPLVVNGLAHRPQRCGRCGSTTGRGSGATVRLSPGFTGALLGWPPPGLPRQQPKPDNHEQDRGNRRAVRL